MFSDVENLQVLLYLITCIYLTKHSTADRMWHKVNFYAKYDWRDGFMPSPKELERLELRLPYTEMITVVLSAPSRRVYVCEQIAMQIFEQRSERRRYHSQITQKMKREKKLKKGTSIKLNVRKDDVPRNVDIMNWVIGCRRFVWCDGFLSLDVWHIPTLRWATLRLTAAIIKEN